MRGRFLSFEGVEGCGKSTQIARLHAALEEAGHSVILTREPGGTATGELIRKVLQHDYTGEAIAPVAELHLFAASRAQHVAQVIAPALERGDWVLCDRFIDSSLSYQGLARDLGLERVLEMNRDAVGDCWPEITFWLDLPLEEAFARVADRQGPEDRFESEARSFHERVASGYAELAERFPERIHRVDASLTEEELFQCICEAVSALEGDSL